MKTKLLVITGPTVTGKTDMALKLAKQFNGELVSADSRQVYVGLDIGTGKFSSRSNRVEIKKGMGFWEIDGIKIWAYDLITVQKQYTVADYIKDAQRYITDIIDRNKLPILVGGTYFYIKSLLDGLPNLSIPVDTDLRARLAGYSLIELQGELKKLAPQRWQELNESDRQNPRRLLRIMEIIYMNPYINNDKKWIGFKNNFDILKIGLTAPREILYQSVDKGVLVRVDQGIVEEAEQLYKNGLTFERMKVLGLEYQVLADYLAGKIRGLDGSNGLVEILQNKIHGFVRRQLTWFKKDTDIKWFDITDKNTDKKLENAVYKWYYNDGIKVAKKKHAKKN